MKKFFVLWVTAALAVTSAFSSCGKRNAGAAESAAVSRDTLVYGENIAAQGVFHPTVNTTDADQRAVLLIYSRLVATDASGNYVPELAESYTFSPDATNVTFYAAEGR